MGLTSSKPDNPFGELKTLVSRLGDRNPFGDDEILRISRCMAYLVTIRGKSAANADDENPKENNHCNVTTSNTFLTDWAVFCSTLPPAEFSPDSQYVDLLSVDSNLLLESSYSAEVITRQQRIRHIMTIIEKHVLPPNFGDTLCENYFTLLAPMGSNDLVNDTNADSPLDAPRRIAWERLEKFMDGASETSRRGSRKALTCIYKCCALHGDTTQKASAKDLIDLAYRLALASTIYKKYTKNQIDMEEQDERFRLRALQKEEKEMKIQEGKIDSNQEEENADGQQDEDDDEEEDEEEAVIPPFDPSTMFPQDIGETLTTSLLQYSFAPSVGLSQGLDPGLDGNETSSANGNGKNPNKVSLEIFLAWAETTAPCLSSTIETFMHQIFFPDKPYPPSRSEFVFPNLRHRHSAFVPKKTNSESSPLLFTFATMSPSLGGAWHRIYTSDSDGLSFNRLQNSLLGYGGPTLLIIKEADLGGIFGAYTSTAWKESKDFYGNSDSFLYTVQPAVQVLRPSQRGTGTNFMYCNPESRSKGYDGLAHGIGFGGTTDKPRLFISESFDGCTAGTGDLTFEPGRLLPPREVGHPNSSKYFDLESLEVWGVGGDSITLSALDARHKQREIVASNIRKARKVDKAAFLDDFRSGLIESKAFKHRGEIRGRGDCHIDDEDKKNYVYE
jgi:hypothetical protein